ncbi:hypothetical protein BDP55DRAFT_435006 [Colletotrichum godetiae]|uniref:Uncharacterized protein n=1 Tax=Colletotrichum godetiae TaxID=1209918 RepID=A0AAJ0ARY7_9PEZI|nr:uncharacterized protein BDP55DRAFT_435006 [Colletotrichum godetiae]KAK1689283.1 hypothetical protein BDP55DRAFT_435006 [Colletotrichum godetiae]
MPSFSGTRRSNNRIVSRYLMIKFLFSALLVFRTFAMLHNAIQGSCHACQGRIGVSDGPNGGLRDCLSCLGWGRGSVAQETLSRRLQFYGSLEVAEDVGARGTTGWGG